MSHCIAMFSLMDAEDGKLGQQQVDVRAGEVLQLQEDCVKGKNGHEAQTQAPARHCNHLPRSSRVAMKLS